MEASDIKNKIAEEQKNQQDGKKPAATQKETSPVKEQQHEKDEDENPYGGINSRNLKKNLGCGG